MTNDQTPRCPYHVAQTRADIRIEWTYGPRSRTMVDHVCDAHHQMHTASLKQAARATPVSVRRL